MASKQPMNAERIVKLLHSRWKPSQVAVKFFCEETDIVVASIGDHLYQIFGGDDAEVYELNDERDQLENRFSAWVQGVLNGLTRNDAGELVKQC